MNAYVVIILKYVCKFSREGGGGLQSLERASDVAIFLKKVKVLFLFLNPHQGYFLLMTLEREEGREQLRSLASHTYPNWGSNP